MSPQFLAFMPFIFEWEGESYENDPDDPGGETKYGIDKRSHPDVDIKNLTKEEALSIYWDEWQKAGCEHKGSPFAEVYFNCAVNMGLGRARQFDKKIDGEDYMAFLKQQEAYYNDLAFDDHTGKPTHFHKYLKGWLNRTEALKDRFA